MYHKKYIYSIIFTFISVLAGMTLQAQNLTLTQTDIIKIPGITKDTMLYTLTPAQMQSTRVYYDGLNRPVQQVGIKASPLQKDLIQPIAYDNLGRQTTGYLPYVGADGNGSYRSDALTSGQAAFYSNGATDKIADDSKPYSTRVIENSPLQRLLQAGTVGNGFQPGEHYSVVNYRSNSNAIDGAIIKWLPDGSRGANYNDTTLAVNEATDAAGKTARTFTDKNGHVVLKRQVLDSSHNLDTYYVYNDAGNLSFTIPPKAVKLLTDNPTYTLTQTAVAALIYKYQYDDKGRLYIKTIPSAGDVYMIYDPLDRLVLVQDGNLRINNRWYFIKYDIAGRIVVQGAYTDAVNTSQSLMQGFVDGQATNYNTAWFEKRNNSASFGYYTNTVFPTSGANVLAANYYDDYDLNQNGAPDYTYSSQGLTGEATATTVTRGLLTMTRTVTIGSGLTSTWLTKVIFYDKNGSQIQVQSNNQLVTTISDVATSVPDFTGATLQTKVVKYHAAGTATTVLTTFAYDHVYRLNSVKQKYNTNTETTVATYQYNELGQMVDKRLGITATAPSGLQSVDYRYNIRGQLLSINNSKLTDDHTTTNTNDDTNDVFGEELSYDITNTPLGSTARYDGSITAVKWMSLDGSNTKSNERGYRYQYDGVGRFTQAVYAERLATATAGTAFSLNADGFTEKITGYDENGNILGLMRYSSTPGGSGGTKIDGLKYSYSTTIPNKLLTVTDSTGNAGGFNNYTGAATNYIYSTAGNLTADPFKGITGIAYNLINRVDNITLTYPATATGRKIDYTYDATGKLIRKRQIDNSVVVKTTDYIDGFVYTADGTNAATLAYFGMPEGRVRNDAGTFKQEFIITDHQGNARISFEDNGSGQALVKQENSYYAFGMSMTSTMALPTTPNKNLYNGGSEWQNDFSNLPDWQQTFYRNYDATLGRWLAVDPMAEQTSEMSVYHYGANNPVMFNDPLGNLTQAEFFNVLNVLGSSPNGGEWHADNPGSVIAYGDDLIEFYMGAAFMSAHGSFGANPGWAQNYEIAAVNYNINNNGEKAAYANKDKRVTTTGFSLNLSTGFYSVVYNNAEVDQTGSNMRGEVTVATFGHVQDDVKNLADDAWNSSIARSIVPDMVGLNVGFTNVLYVGYGGSLQGSLMLRGKDAGSIHFSGSFTARVGPDVGVSFTQVKGWSTKANPRLSSFSELTGWGADASISAEGGTFGVWTSFDNRFNPSWVGTSSGVAAGPPLGGKWGGSAGVSYTWEIGNGFRLF